MKFWSNLLALLCVVVLVSGCAGMQQSGTVAERTDVLYTCDCGPQCTCSSVSTQPGNCSCGKPMKWGHILKVEGSEAVLCQCGEGCKCSGLNPEDPTKCSCGMKVKRVNLDGTGVYYCNCGGSCMCNNASEAPGKCKCGMQLKKS